LDRAAYCGCGLKEKVREGRVGLGQKKEKDRERRGGFGDFRTLELFFVLKTTQQHTKPMQRHECIKHFGES
jgi:hypothetical protein